MELHDKKRWETPGSASSPGVMVMGRGPTGDRRVIKQCNELPPFSRQPEPG